jgi:hypothetical protein
MKLSRNKKGTEKPIEIFIALFVILAVAMVLLKMFSGQISSKTKELKEMEQRNKLKENLANAKDFCDTKCTNSMDNNCALKDKAQFCISYIENGIDLNGNGIINDYDATFLGGIGVCEDQLYCPQITDCNCGVKLTMKNCINILCTYWVGEQGLDVDKADGLLERYYKPGSCTMAKDDEDLHWYWANWDLMICS